MKLMLTANIGNNEWVHVDTDLSGTLVGGGGAESAFYVPFTSADDMVDCLRMITEQARREVAAAIAEIPEGEVSP